jgi:hypothetical protein
MYVLCKIIILWAISNAAYELGGLKFLELLLLCDNMLRINFLYVL